MMDNVCKQARASPFFIVSSAGDARGGRARVLSEPNRKRATCLELAPAPLLYYRSSRVGRQAQGTVAQSHLNSFRSSDQRSDADHIAGLHELEKIARVCTVHMYVTAARKLRAGSNQTP
jgi:hypothetical protein